MLGAGKERSGDPRMRHEADEKRRCAVRKSVNQGREAAR